MKPRGLLKSASQVVRRHEIKIEKNLVVNFCLRMDDGNQHTQAMKKYPQLPVHVVEEHNNALQHILRAVGSKHLPFTHNLLIHFDSHPDLLIPADLKASEVFNVPDMLEKLSIENWILVAAYAGQISTIVWVKPPWASQIEDGHYTFLIGEQRGTENIRISCPALYFVGEMLYCKAEDLENAKEVSLHVHTLWSEVDVEELKEDLLQLIKNHDNYYTLDVDLDFFSTTNPFLTMHSEVNMYERLKEIYRFNYTQTEETQVIEEHVKRRCKQIKTLQGVFSHLQTLEIPMVTPAEVDSVCQAIEDPKQRELVAALILDLAKEYPGNDEEEGVYWELVHDAGSTIDDDAHQLPHHVSSQEEIDSLMEAFCSLVACLPQPTLVTMARSSVDDYCPPDQVDGIQETVCSFLRKKYDIDCQKHYQD